MVKLAGGGLAAEVERHKRAVRANPRDAQAHALLGLTLQKLGRLAEAVASQRRALQLAPKIEGLWAVMADALRDLGRHEEAAESYRKALEENSNDAELHKALSVVLRQLGRFDEAVASARQAVLLCPGEAAMHANLAAALHSTQDLKGAADSLARVVELMPENIDARAQLAGMLLDAEEYDTAATLYRAIIERDAAHVQAHLGLATCLRAKKQFKEAVGVLEQALAVVPDDPLLTHDLGFTHIQGGDLARAQPYFERANELRPDNLQTLQALTRVCFDRGLWQKALQYARRLGTLRIDSPGMHSTFLFILSHCCSSAEELTREHFKYGEQWETPLLAGRAPHTNDRNPARVLKVGFVSADLYRHAVATFVELVFERLKDSPGLELHIYSNSKTEDEVTARLKGYVAHWHSIVDLNDEAAEQMIRADAIDILVDLSGHSANNRLHLFARKPAPIQLSWIGYAGTTGLKSMDYVISDRLQLPPGRCDDQFTEKIVRLPLNTPWQPEFNAPPLNPLPALTNGHITFGSFNRVSKLSREVIAVWSQLLRAVPDAKLLLGGLVTGADETVLGWFDEEGIARDRLLLRYRAGIYNYLQQHHEVDVHLAAFPYTGGTTACHALWMGVPTLTITGETNPSFATAAFLNHLGLNAFVANDVPSFLALGQFLSQNLPTLAALRQTMRERFTNSLLGYPGIFSASFELALRRMWQRWCDGLPADHFDVRLSELTDAAQPETTP